MLLRKNDLRVYLIIICIIISTAISARPYLIILGTAQDGGYPHLGCTKQGCNLAWEYDSLRRYVVSFALVDSSVGKWWLFEATPDIKYQMHLFRTLTHEKLKYLPEAIFITHAHIGHYTGLMQFGREVMDTKELAVYVLPRMRQFLENNGPWSQLVKLKNISLHTLNTDSALMIAENIRIETFLVPHRDEYSETAGFRIIAGDRKYLFIPDINKWDKWDKNIREEVKKVNVALLDATFYDHNELPNRKISEVPHPLMTETMDIFKNEDIAIKSKIYFIHFNHTNPILWDTNLKSKITSRGFNIAEQGEIL